jgi:para-aminobenzoate synthetase component 1
MRLFAYPYPYQPPEQVFTPFSSDRYSLFFDSAREGHPLNRFSYLCVHPFETIEAKNGRVTVTNAQQSLSLTADPFAVIKDRLHDWGAGAQDTRYDLPPFQGGAAGYFGYDLARGIEHLPEQAKDDPSLPDMAIGLYDTIIAFDHAEKKSWIVIRARHEGEAERRKKTILEKIAAHQTARNQNADADIVWTPDCDDVTYEKKIASVINYIYAGDIFQANLSRRYTAPRPAGFDSYAHYQVLRRVNPAPFAAYMNFGGFELSGASPESFLSVTDRRIETRPIKGTMPATRRPDELAGSQKDHAENAMIVDLLRNDLSKVCDDHSITVPQMCGVESFTGLHHLVSIVRGTLRGDMTSIDALKACFPGGSITGAPKVRAMEIIEELEPFRRGPYCGAMGMIGFDDTMNTNIIIRTLVYTQNLIHLQAGGGIVADSVPETELMETKIKIEKIFESFRTYEETQSKAA